MTGRLLCWFGESDEPALDAVTDVKTMRNVVDREAIAAAVPHGWTVRSDIVRYGNDTLTDVLVFGHDRTRQELAVVPESNVDPNGAVRFHHHDRNAGYRRELPVTKPSLAAGLSFALDRIERFQRFFDGRGATLPDTGI